MSDQKQKLNMIMTLGFGNQIRARSVQVAAYTFFTRTSSRTFPGSAYFTSKAALVLRGYTVGD